MNHISKNAFLFFWTILFSLNLHAQTFFPIKEGILWGVIDNKGEITVNPSYNYIGDFNNGNLAIAIKDGKRGLINGKGETVLATEYQKIRFINDNYLSVCSNEGCALANTSGKILSSFNYQAIFKFNSNFLKTYKSQKFGLLSIGGNEVQPTTYDAISNFPERPGLIQLTKNTKKGLADIEGNLILEAVYDELTIDGNRINAKKEKAFTSVWLEKNNEVAETKEFPNEMALNLDSQARLKKKQATILQNNPEARKPRWVLNTFRYSLENGVGKNLLKGKEFFDVGIDETLQLSLGREVIPPAKKEDKEQLISYLIDHQNAKVIFSAPVKDMVISDFNVAKYARATIDTLWDALIDKEGNLIEEVDGKPISNIGNFKDGLAWVKSGKTYGFIDKNGQLTIPFEYQIVSDFEDGHAVARKNGLFGCIDTRGKAVIPFAYDGIDIPKGNICRVKKGKGREGNWGAINLQNKEIIPFEYSLIYPFNNGVARMRKGRSWGLINDKGKVIIPPSINCDYLDDFKNGIAMVGMERWVEKTPAGPVVRYRKQGFIKQDGTYLIEPVYDKIDDFETIWQKQEGLARIYKDGKVGYVNYQGTIELEAIYDETYRFDTIWRNNSGISKVKKDNKYGYLDHNGKEIVAPIYDEVAEDFILVGNDSVGVSRVQKEGKYGFVNYEGKEVVPVEYDFASKANKGVIPIKFEGKWGVVDTLNNKKLAFEYDGARFLDGSSGQFIELLKKETAYFEVDATGRFTKEVEGLPSTQQETKYNKSPKFIYRSEFDNNGLAVVEKKGKLALVNGNGQLLTKYQYKEIDSFADGLALVRLDAKERKDQLFGYIGINGKEVIPPQYKLAKRFGGGHAAVLNRSTWGFIDKTGKMVISPKFKKPGEFSGGYAIINDNEIYDKNGNKAGQFQLNGKITKGFTNERAIVQSTSGEFHITPTGLPAYFVKYDEVTPFIGNIAFAKRGEVWELSRSTGDYTNQLKFKRANKNSYIEKYGERRKETLPDGTILEDKGWKLIEKGTWKMIDSDGNFLSEMVFTEVKLNADGNYVVSIENKSGLADTEGKIVAERKYELIRAVSKDVIRLEKAGEIGYLNTNGTWLRKIE